MVTVRDALGAHEEFVRVATPGTSRGTGLDVPWPVALTADAIWDESWEDDRTYPPPQGDLTPGQATLITDVLSRGRAGVGCSFATWTGYADVCASGRPVVLPPDREMVAVDATLDDVHDLAARWGRYPLRWRAADGSFAVGADLYARSVVVAGRDLGALVTADGPVRGVRVPPEHLLPSWPA